MLRRFGNAVRRQQITLLTSQRPPKNFRKTRCNSTVQICQGLSFFLCFNLSIVVTSGRQTLPGLLCSMKQSEVFIILFFCYFSFFHVLALFKFLRNSFPFRCTLLGFVWSQLFCVYSFTVRLLLLFIEQQSYILFQYFFRHRIHIMLNAKVLFFVTEQILFVALCASFDPVVCFTQCKLCSCILLVCLFVAYYFTSLAFAYCTYTFSFVLTAMFYLASL